MLSDNRENSDDAISIRTSQTVTDIWWTEMFGARKSGELHETDGVNSGYITGNISVSS